mgnify:CR=1 FL=1
MPYKDLATGDLAFVSLGGAAQGGLEPSSEWRFHRDIYAARPEFAAIVHTLSVLHLQLDGWALAADNPDGQQAVAVENRIAQALNGLSASGLLVTDAKDRLGQQARDQPRPDRRPIDRCDHRHLEVEEGQRQALDAGAVFLTDLHASHLARRLPLHVTHIAA